MHVVFAVPLLVLIATPASSQPAVPATNSATERNEAQWAEWDAQARIEDGDYEGARQAEQQADMERRAASARAAPPSDR